MELASKQYGLGGQQDFYDYFSRGKRRGKKKGGIKRIVRKIKLRKPKRKAAPPPPPQVRRPAPPVRTPPPPPPIEESSADLPVYDAPVVNENIPFPESEAPEPGSEFTEPEPMSEEEAYDYFLGIGKKGKQKRQERRQERRAIRVDNRKTKVDERKAGVERMRAETQMIQQMGSPTTTPSSNLSQATPAGNTESLPGEIPGEIPQEDYDKKSTPDDKKSTTLVIVLSVVGVLVAGSLVWMLVERNRNMMQRAA
jgi:hypothetical protein